jgi:hypothetical protein
MSRFIALVEHQDGEYWISFNAMTPRQRSPASP